MTTFPQDAVDSPRIAAAFNEFASSIAAYNWSSELWEDHLDAVLSVLRQYGHYPPDDERNDDDGNEWTDLTA